MQILTDGRFKTVTSSKLSVFVQNVHMLVRTTFLNCVQGAYEQYLCPFRCIIHTHLNHKYIWLNILIKIYITLYA